jgi:iron complex outermembrane receptor protein
LKSIVVIAILNLVFWQVVYSQEVSDTINIQPVKIVAKKIPDSFKVTYIDSIVIKESANLAELLQEHSPVFVKNYGLGSLASVSFRGTGAAHTKVLWNGININSPTLGQVDFSLFPTLFYDNVELHHGASGLIDGNGAIGGSVNLSSKPVYNKGFGTSLQQSIGSYNSYITAGMVTFSNKKWCSETQVYYNSSKNNFDFVNITLLDEPTVIQSNASIQQYGVQQTMFKKLNNGDIGIRLWYFNSDRMLPPEMSKDDASQNQKDESIRALLEWKKLKGNFSYKWLSALVKDQLIYVDSSSNIYSLNNSYLVSNKLLTKYYLGNNFILSNDLTVGYEQAKADGYEATHSRLNNSWLISINKQFNRINIDLFNRFMSVDNNTKLISPSVGIQYSLLKNKQLKLNVNSGINYNYPTFNDLYWKPGGNPNLKPEQARMVELGSSYSHLFNKTNLGFEVTGFYSYVYDWILWAQTPSGFWSPSNLKEVENKGIELSLKAETIINKLIIRANANYATTYSTNMKAQSSTDNSVGKQLRYVPFHQVNYSIRALYKSYSLNYNYNYTGKRFTTSDNNWYLPANFTSDISLSKKFIIGKKSSVSTSFKINNLFDQDYQSIAWRAMPGRNYLFILTLDLN